MSKTIGLLLATAGVAAMSTASQTACAAAMQQQSTAAPAIVQDQAPTPSAADQVATTNDEVIVTGTRTQNRTVATSLAPIDVLGKNEIQSSGQQSVRDILGTLVPSISVTQSSGGGAALAVRTVTLRGLSSDEVLVLVNGKRRHNTATLFITGTTQNGQSPPDLDLIPTSAISRVEVLRDGAAAQYGSDAIAGVVNIILKNDYSGAVSTQLGVTARGDGAQGRVQADYGIPITDHGHLHLSVDGTLQQRNVRTVPSTAQFYDTIGGLPDPREATVNRNVNRNGQPEVSGVNGAYDAAIALGGGTELYTFGTASYRDARAFQNYRTPRDASNSLTIYPDGYSPRLDVRDHDYQVTGGIRGDGPAAIHFDLSTNYSRDSVDYNSSTTLNASYGPISPTNFYLGTVAATEWTTDLDLQRKLGLGLTEPLAISVGAEYRQNTYRIVAGDVASYANGGYLATTGTQAGIPRVPGAQGTGGFSPDAAGLFKRNNWSAYIDLEQTLTKGLDIALAGRHEQYSDFGSTDNGKASFRFEPFRGFAIRGTASTGFRAPTLQQEHYASSASVNVVVNGVRVLLPVSALPVDSPVGRALGAVPLKPEKSTSFSAGFVATPTSRLNLTVDAYQIRIDDRILRSSTFTGTVVRQVLAASGNTGSAGGYYFTNAADTRTRGLDIVASYRARLGETTNANVSLSANFNKTEFLRVGTLPATLAAAGLVLIDRARIGDFTVGTPRHKFIANAYVTHGPVSLNLRGTYYGSVTQVATDPTLDDTSDGKAIVDAELGYELRKGVKLFIGGNNLLNTFPTVLKPGNQVFGAAYYNNYAPYGTQGGFYYGKLTLNF